MGDGADGAVNELSYFPEGQRHSSSVTAVFQFAGPALLAAATVLITRSVPVALLVGGAGVVWHLWKRRRARVVPRAKLRVEGGVLHLSGLAFSSPIALPLSELLDVYLDTKTIQRIQENPGPIPDLRFINATVSGEMDTARIALELQNETYYLTEERLSHTDANEWFSKIRRFLRRNGWVPDDEREG